MRNVCIFFFLRIKYWDCFGHEEKPRAIKGWSRYCNLAKELLLQCPLHTESDRTSLVWKLCHETVIWREKKATVRYQDVGSGLCYLAHTDNICKIWSMPETECMQMSNVGRGGGFIGSSEVKTESKQNICKCRLPL